MEASYNETPLGKKTDYIDTYTPSLLCAIPRWDGREELDIDFSELPFRGIDIWNAYELSWLNGKGKPIVAAAEFELACTTKNIIESKSFKLYLNSFNQTRFNSKQDVIKALENDLSVCAGGPVMVRIIDPNHARESSGGDTFGGQCLDNLDVAFDSYEHSAELLEVEGDAGENDQLHESLYSHLLKTNCPVTQQPDWASVFIRYSGQPINHESLLRYIVSFRQHKGFHEQCVEQMFVEIMERCAPTQLTVYARYTRRGGLDINPFRSNYEAPLPNKRLLRQ